MIVVIDYNVGNVKSVCNALQHIGCDAEVSRDPAQIEKANGLVLPGVAAFGYAREALGSADVLVRQAADACKPILGICVGHQLLFDESCEYGPQQGLGLIHGAVVPIPAEQTVPHMGWNLVELPEEMELLAGLGPAKHFYFAHSFHARVEDEQAKVAHTDYGFPLTASVQKGNIYGVQFHPEKSGPQGLQVLRNFHAICKRRV
ncbi:MAG: imidazole glycerol phosphate synthase subunit HisH [Planctomycetes bacterium]|jgi:glutamine amidotransferase|nr:imidazole glycerol phosphate synthase subunit HisH [Planctomycetota bacterium]